MRIFTHPSSCYGRSSSNHGDDVVKPASSLVIQNQQSMISSGYDVMSIPEFHGLQFDLMRIIHRLMQELIPICAWMTSNARAKAVISCNQAGLSRTMSSGLAQGVGTGLTNKRNSKTISRLYF